MRKKKLPMTKWKISRATKDGPPTRMSCDLSDTIHLALQTDWPKSYRLHIKFGNKGDIRYMKSIYLQQNGSDKPLDDPEVIAEAESLAADYIRKLAADLEATAAGLEHEVETG